MELSTQLPRLFEIISISVLVLVLAADLLIVIRRPHVPSLKESSLWVGFYVSLALVFALLMLLVGDREHAGQFIAGWLTEYSLSIDNLFVFVIIMARFAVPAKLQQQVLMIGIIIALILRGIFILLGAQLIESFSFVFYLFGAFLLYTAYRQAFDSEDDGDEATDNLFIRMIKKRVATTDEYHGSKIRVAVDGRKAFTPMLIVFLAIGSTDLLFALDSIPAIFGITQSPFIVFTANIFALMGLRQLYFMLGGLLQRLVYLHYGIAFILAFIGVKLVLQAMHENEVFFINGGQNIEWAPEIGTFTSLGVILGAMAVATVASLIKSRSVPKQEVAPDEVVTADASGSVRGSAGAPDSVRGSADGGAGDGEVGDGGQGGPPARRSASPAIDAASQTIGRASGSDAAAAPATEDERSRRGGDRR